MKNTDERLFILGIISAHQAHGYQITEALNAPWMPITIDKAKVYRILNALEKDGYLNSVTEKKENYPPRQVYSITESGQEEFKRALKERLTTRAATHLPDAVSLNFLGLLEPTEQVELLKQRLQKGQDQLKDLGSVDLKTRKDHPGIDYLISQLEFEINWLEQLIKTKEQNG